MRGAGSTAIVVMRFLVTVNKTGVNVTRTRLGRNSDVTRTKLAGVVMSVLVMVKKDTAIPKQALPVTRLGRDSDATRM
jgi:hypothetical protein